MDAPAEQLFEARVTPELRRLLAGLRVPRRPPAERGASETLDHGPHRARQDAAPAAEEPWKQLSLRRDGALPARFRGAMLHEVRSDHDPEYGYLRLFASVEGEAVAHLAYLPPESIPARPIFRVARVATAEALHRFIDESAPALCLAVCTTPHGLPAHCSACDMLRLPIDLPGLAARENPLSSSRKERHDDP